MSVIFHDTSTFHSKQRQSVKIFITFFFKSMYNTYIPFGVIDFEKKWIITLVSFIQIVFQYALTHIKVSVWYIRLTHYIRNIIRNIIIRILLGILLLGYY